MIDLQSLILMLVFLPVAAGAVACWIGMVSERRRERVSAMRLMLFPFFIESAAFSDRGRVFYWWFNGLVVVLVLLQFLPSLLPRPH
jgi:hypothetical protein